MTARRETRAGGMNALWRLRLSKAGGAEGAKAALGEELKRLAADSRDVRTLAAVHRAHSQLLKDEEGARAVEEKIRQIDPTWYPERGVTSLSMVMSRGVPSLTFHSGRQFQLSKRLTKVGDDLPAREQTAQLEQLLRLNPEAELRRQIYYRLLSIASTNADLPRAFEYGGALLAENQNDTEALTSLARALAAQKKDLATALAYSRRAMEATAEFRYTEPPADMSPRIAASLFSEEQQRESFMSHRRDVVDTHAFVLAQAEKYEEAEAALRQSLAMEKTEGTLSRLVDVLRKLGRAAEAEKLAAELAGLWREKIKSNIESEPAKDFELSTIDGRKVRLSELKGKVVLVNYWATWCVPCLKEMSVFAELYKKHQGRGVEILAVSVDAPEDRQKVVEFTRQRQLSFPVLYDQGTARINGIDRFPTTLFIDAQGRERYRASGFSLEHATRDMELIINELLNGAGATEAIRRD